MPVTVNIGARD